MEKEKDGFVKYRESLQLEEEHKISRIPADAILLSAVESVSKQIFERQSILPNIMIQRNPHPLANVSRQYHVFLIGLRTFELQDLEDFYTAPILYAQPMIRLHIRSSLPLQYIFVEIVLSVVEWSIVEPKDRPLTFNVLPQLSSHFGNLVKRSFSSTSHANNPAWSEPLGRVHADQRVGAMDTPFPFTHLTRFSSESAHPTRSSSESTHPSRSPSESTHPTRSSSESNALVVSTLDTVDTEISEGEEGEEEGRERGPETTSSSPLETNGSLNMNPSNKGTLRNVLNWCTRGVFESSKVPRLDSPHPTTTASRPRSMSFSQASVPPRGTLISSSSSAPGPPLSVNPSSVISSAPSTPHPSLNPIPSQPATRPLVNDPAWPCGIPRHLEPIKVDPSQMAVTDRLLLEKLCEVLPHLWGKSLVPSTLSIQVGMAGAQRYYVLYAFGFEMLVVEQLRTLVQIDPVRITHVSLDGYSKCLMITWTAHGQDTESFWLHRRPLSDVRVMMEHLVVQPTPLLIPKPHVPPPSSASSISSILLPMNPPKPKLDSVPESPFELDTDLASPIRRVSQLSVSSPMNASPSAMVQTVPFSATPPSFSSPSIALSQPSSSAPHPSSSSRARDLLEDVFGTTLAGLIVDSTPVPTPIGPSSLSTASVSAVSLTAETIPLPESPRSNSGPRSVNSTPSFSPLTHLSSTSSPPLTDSLATSPVPMTDSSSTISRNGPPSVANPAPSHSVPPPPPVHVPSSLLDSTLTTSSLPHNPYPSVSTLPTLNRPPREFVTYRGPSNRSMVSSEDELDPPPSRLPLPGSVPLVPSVSQTLPPLPTSSLTSTRAKSPSHKSSRKRKSSPFPRTMVHHKTATVPVSPSSSSQAPSSSSLASPHPSLLKKEGDKKQRTTLSKSVSSRAPPLPISSSSFLSKSNVPDSSLSMTTKWSAPPVKGIDFWNNPKALL